MNKRTAAAIIAALLLTTFIPAAAPAAAVNARYCPYGPSATEPGPEALNVPLDTYVLPAGTPVCVTGAGALMTTGLLIADGVTTLGEYLDRAGLPRPVWWFSTYAVAAPPRPGPELPATDTL